MIATKPETNPNRFFQAVDKSRWELPLPDGARRLIASGKSDGRSDAALNFWLASDPNLVQRLIQWSNSPLFNLGHRFSTIDEVHAVLEKPAMSQLSVLAGVRTLFLPNSRFESYSREQLWRHSIAVGAVARLVARTCHVSDALTAFTAGAVHDIGLLASERLYPEKFELLLSELDSLTDTSITERQFADWDHQMLGAELLDRWGFPKAVCDAARFHHQPHLAHQAEDEKLIGCVVVADYLCSRCGWTELGLHNVAQPPDAVFKMLNIDATCLTILWHRLYETLEHTLAFV